METIKNAKLNCMSEGNSDCLLLKYSVILKKFKSQSNG